MEVMPTLEGEEETEGGEGRRGFVWAWMEKKNTTKKRLINTLD